MINPQSAQALLTVCADLVNQQVKSVYLLLSTNGGQVMEGVALYTALRAFPFTLTIHNIGNVDSVGNIVFHGIGFDFTGPFRLEEKLLLERLDSIRADHKRLSGISSPRTLA